MKKVSFILIAAMAMVSCANTYDAKKVTLSDQTDSLNYAIGLVNGAQIKLYHLRQDSSTQTVNEFIDALKKGYETEPEEISVAEQTGRNIANFVRRCEKDGIAQHDKWSVNEKMFFQAMVNGIKKEYAVMDVNTAREYFQQKYVAANETENAPQIGKLVKASCPTKAKVVQLKSESDSLNYAFGLLNGDGVGREVLADDSLGNDFKVLVKAINQGMKSKVRNPQLVMLAENIGNSFRQQEEEGLMGIPELEIRFELIQQGFVNGLRGFDEQMTMQEANVYVNTVYNELNYGSLKEEGEAFLAENAERKEVKVTESGLQYEVLKQGKGKKPAETDRVKVHYHGTLIDGTVFDSSVERGEPVVFALNQVISGWTEGLQLMPVGSKYKFYIPYNLAYGEQGRGQTIPPYSALVFEVELLGIEK